MTNLMTREQFFNKCGGQVIAVTHLVIYQNLGTPVTNCEGDSVSRVIPLNKECKLDQSSQGPARGHIYFLLSYPLEFLPTTDSNVLLYVVPTVEL